MEAAKENLVYSCKNCLNPLALAQDLISKKYLTKSGKGFMFTHVMNMVIGAKEEKKLLTGTYLVADVRCSKCDEPLGWKYVETYDLKQRYKEGMFVLERLKLVKTI